MAKYILLAASLFAGAFAADKATITPWCANSVRVQVQPSGSALKPTPGALKNRVSAYCLLLFKREQHTRLVQFSRTTESARVFVTLFSTHLAENAGSPCCVFVLIVICCCSLQ